MSKLYNEAWERFIEECGEAEPELEAEFGYAWNTCKKEVLKLILEYMNSDTWDFNKKEEIIKKLEEL